MHRQLAVFGIMACLAGLPSATAGSEPLPYTVGTIVIDQLPVLDETNYPWSKWVPGAVNKIHIQTRQEILVRELLFAEGDPYNDDLVEETERNMRRMDIIGDVVIYRDTVGSRINLQVVTRDRWSLEVAFSYKQSGGVTVARFTVQDENFLGKAQKLTASANFRSERQEDPYGAQLSFSERRIRGSQISLYLHYGEAEELRINAIGLTKPFFTEQTHWAGGVYADEIRMTLYHYHRSDILYSTVLTQNNRIVWGAYSVGGKAKLRAGASFNHRRTGSERYQLEPRLNFDLISVSLGPRILHFVKESYLDNFGRTEDLAIGTLANFIAATNISPGRPRAADYFFRADVKQTLYHPAGYYLGVTGTASSFLSKSRWLGTVYSFSLTQFFRPWPRQLLTSRLSAVFGRNWSPDRQIVLGAFNGLRGYPAFAFDGQNSLLLNVEQRVFPPLQAWFFRIGGVLFFDAGNAWENDMGGTWSDLHTAYGFGLRVENVIQSGVGILRVDFAFRPDMDGIAEITISTDHIFSAFQGMAYIPPFAVR